MKPLPSTPAGAVLFVDDEETVLNIAETILELEGFEVVTAHSADEAWNKWKEREGEIDCVVTDLIMPGASGLELAKRLLNCRAELKIFLTSGYSPETLSEVGHTLPPEFVFVQKPFRFDHLAANIRSAVRGDGENGAR